ncbi:glutamate racemase [Hydrogenoanaerobacterium saccharovorans]|uniref:Glutamate racemase n=1 Tax=Hydrogenoanaerobacterium saccharovorans TaxID=474960 RepID=A0A1H8AHR9_9FIRM|nr:glutamate racemase [Hydrogenoanaerobacterium saccharovorans]RPF47949.1 glutamate racemase [Hydrogenoanaerobacterium saccharovorans]SEM70036.1 glutamate racemase [Hydrogenoanaerobacterium saccharovorans]
MNENRKKIGVLDSGVGGLTVVKELEQLLPNEDIVYFGDNKNCPYGNRTADNIVEIAHNTIGFLQNKSIKAVVVACNTTSSLIHRFEKEYPFPIFSIIKPAAQYVVRHNLPSVGVIATQLTINTGAYKRLIHEGNANIAVYGEPSHNLAALVDSGKFDMDAITEEISVHMNHLLQQHPVKHVIYGCTHYPIVADVFEKAAPEVHFINPAFEQAKAVAEYLKEHNLLNDADGHSFDIYMSGSASVYEAILQRLEIKTPANIYCV